jgi:hypothetical protein
MLRVNEPEEFLRTETPIIQIRGNRAAQSSDHLVMVPKEQNR